MQRLGDIKLVPDKIILWRKFSNLRLNILQHNSEKEIPFELINSNDGMESLILRHETAMTSLRYIKIFRNKVNKYK